MYLPVFRSHVCLYLNGCLFHTTYFSGTHFLPSLPSLFPPLASLIPSTTYKPLPPLPTRAHHAHPRPPTPKTQLANDAITRHCRRLPVTQATDRKDRRAGSAHRKRRCPPACHISGAFKCLQEGLSADFPLLYAPVSA